MEFLVLVPMGNAQVEKESGVEKTAWLSASCERGLLRLPRGIYGLG